jgi:hypothetical protein
MTSIDASPDGIFDIAWSPDSKWLTYVAGEDEVRLANIDGGEMRVIGSGSSPNVTNDLQIVLQRDDEIVLVTGSATQILVNKKALFKDAPKRFPLLAPDSKALVFVVCNVFDKVSQAQNAYQHRHFLGFTALDKSKPTLAAAQWYGGQGAWFPEADRFAHFEFDSTAGPRVHILSRSGDPEGALPGIYPSISPDSTRIAARPRSGASLMVYTSKGGWSDDEVELTVLKIPVEGEVRMSANPPIWLDNRLVLIDAGDKIWRVDTRRDKAEEMKKIPLPTERRKQSMIVSPDRSKLAVEVRTEDRFELRIVPLS